MSFEIVTDSSGNLPDSVAEQYELHIVPFSYTAQGVTTDCPRESEFDGAAFYGKMREGLTVMTSMVNVQSYTDCFEPLLAAGRDVLYVGMSSGISGSYAAASAAAEILREKYPDRTLETFDTRGASLGEGLQTMRACELRKGGADIATVAATLMRERETMKQYFTVDDLMHLHRGGRVSRAIAVIGTLLKIKPLLTGDPEGRIEVYGKARGMSGALAALAARYTSEVHDPEHQVVGIAHSDAPELAAQLAGMLKTSEAGAPGRIITVCYEPVTGSHVGPGAVALFFRNK